MARSPYYPPADRTTQWFGPGNAIVAPNKVLWHTTETAGGWPGYNGGLAAPNLTYDPWKHQWRQHFPLNASSRALANGPGFSTNRQGTVQIELSCTNGWQTSAVAAGRAVWMFDKQAIQDLADFSRFMNVEWGVPLTDTGVAWPTYPIAPARLSPAAFIAYRGHLGHMHAPYNDHGDPGGLATSRFLAIARQDPATPPPVDPTPEETDMSDFRFTRKSDGATFFSSPTGVRQLDGPMDGTLTNLGLAPLLYKNMDDGPCASLIKSLGGIVPAGSASTAGASAPDAPPGAAAARDMSPGAAASVEAECPPEAAGKEPNP